MRRLVLAPLLLASCGIFEPATELRVENRTSTALNVRAGPCGQPLEAFAALAPGQNRTRSVEPGCWALEGWTDDGRAGAVEVRVSEGTLHVVPFYDKL